MANIPPAARDLRSHVKELGETVTSFCEKKRLDRIQMLRALNGKTRRFSVDFAFSVQDATDGAVQAYRWCTSKRHRSRAALGHAPQSDQPCPPVNG